MPPHPWRALRDDHPEWTLAWADLPDGEMGWTDWTTCTVTLSRSLRSQAERRCTIAHEVAHVRRGPVPDDPVLVAREEAAIEQLVARRLIGLHELGEALAWSRQPSEVADCLWVDEQTLQVRLAHLHPSEAAALRRRLAFLSDPSPTVEL